MYVQYVCMFDVLERFYLPVCSVIQVPEQNPCLNSGPIIDARTEKAPPRVFAIHHNTIMADYRYRLR
jgi:hypothetical protein